MKKILILFLVILFAGLLSACGGSKEKTLSGTEQEAVLAYSEAKTDNLMSGMNANDYAAFSKDFDKDMLNAMPDSSFEKFVKDYDGKLGKYVSRQVNRVTQVGNFVAVVYDAAFEKDNAVTMRVVFRAEEPHEISGLWFSK